MFNKSKDALEIDPNLSIDFHQDNKTGSYVLDSGESDFNRIVSRKQLVGVDISETRITGFEKLYFFKTQEDFDAGISILRNQGIVNPVLLSDEPTEYALVAGSVFIDLNEGESEQLANPIYQINPNNKLEYLPLSDIRQYIVNTWKDTVKSALFGSSSNDSKKSRKAHRLDDEFQMTMLKFTLIFCFIIILFLSVVAYAKTGGGVMSSDHTFAGKPSASANFVYANGKDGSTADQYAQLQYQQTKEMLKKMNVDIDNPTASKELGCYTGN